jgi:hypothetical protein
MNRQVVEAANSSCAATFCITCSEEASDRQQGLGRWGVKGDTEACIVVSPRGRAQQPGMERGHQPGDAPTSNERATVGKLKFELNDRSGRDTLRGRDADAAEADIGAASKRGERLSIEGREMDPRVEPNAFFAATWLSISSSPDVH